MPPDEQQSTELRDQHVGELLKELSGQTTTLVRQELELAKVELTEKGKQAGVGAGMFGGAGVVGLLALATLTACLVLALATTVEPWLAALIVALAYSVGAGALAFVGKDRVKQAAPPVPEKTVENVKEDVQWAKNRASSARR